MSTKKRTKRSFTEELKSQIVNECQNSTVYSVAKRHNISISTINKWIKKHQAILDAAKKVNHDDLDKNDDLEAMYEQLHSILLKRAVILAASTHKLSDIIMALKYLDERTDTEDNSESKRNAFYQELLEKTIAYNEANPS